MGKTKVKQPHGGALTPWQKGESGNPNGRPPSVLVRIREEIGIDFTTTIPKAELYQAIASMMELTSTDLKALFEHPSTPVFVRIVAKGLHDDMRTGNMRSLTEILDRIYGKPEQSSKVQLSGSLGLEALSDDELDEQIRELTK